MSVVDAVAAKFGSRRELALALDIDLSTISQWKRRGEDLIPADRQRQILAAAKERGIDLKPADFFPSEAA